MASSFKHRLSALYLLKILVLTTLFLLGMHLLLQYLNWEVFYQQNGFVYELANRFDLDDEASVPTWFSQVMFLFIGTGAAWTAFLSRTVAIRRLWQLIAVIGVLLSIDEISGLHELFLQSLHNLFFRDAAPTSLNNAWLIVAPFILLAVTLFIWKVAKLLPKRTILLFVGAISIFLVGAIFVDLLASIVERESFLNQGLLIAAEETLELFGIVTVLYAIADYIETQHVSQIKSLFKHLR